MCITKMPWALAFREPLTLEAGVRLDRGQYSIRELAEIG